MSFYSNPAIRAREAREAKQRQREAEVERQNRVRQEIAGDRKRIREDEVLGIQDAKAEYQTQFREYYQQMRATALEQPDPDGFFDAGPALDTDPAVERDIHWNLFLKDHLDFYNSEENRTTLSRYFTVNSCYRYDRWILSAAYKRLLALGLLETEQSLRDADPYVAPEPVAVRQTHFRIEEEGWDNPGKPDDLIEGWDIVTGERATLTRWAVDRLNSSEFKRFARVSMADRNLAGRRSNYGDRYMG
jgi:hypothetical protein